MRIFNRIRTFFKYFFINMEILYPPDYQYSVIYFLIILFLIGLMFVLKNRIEKKKSISKGTSTEAFFLKLTVTLILLGSLYFFALPTYL